jgi:hypothetical protein
MEENLSDDFKKQLFQAEKPSNMFRKPIVNFSMPWNRLFLPCHWIAINVVPGTVAMQNTPSSKQFPDELDTLQMAISLE